MLRDITLGQYYQTESVVHRLDPRVKLIATVIFIISLFVVNNFWGYLLAALFLAGMIKLSHVPFKFMIKGMKAILFLLILTVVFNLFLTPGEPLISLWKLTITKEGLRTAVFMAVRLSFLIIGSIPIIINLKEKGKDVNAMKATVISFALLIGFFYAGDMMLRLFHVDIESFAVAGAFVIFLMSLEMILDIEIFKNQGPIKEATLVPLVFPLLAGAGAFTTLLSLRAEYASINIIIALVLNMIWVFFVVSMTGRVERFLGKGGIYIIRKFFGIILLAISVRLFTANITLLIEALHKS